MTIQRQYSLPNCRLVLQGLSNDGDSSGRPVMALVTNVECYLAGQKTPLVGGRAFLDSLTQTVSRYAQGYLSGIQNLVRRDRSEQAGLVQLQQLSQNLHRLTVRPENGADTPAEVDLTAVDLTTVQLFDLVEAVDQFFADAQTVPDLALKLDSIPKRHVAAAEPLAKRAAPAAIGLSGLAAAAAVLFLLPVPEVRRPEAEATAPATQTATPGASPAGSPANSPAASSPTETTDSPAASSPTETADSTGVTGAASGSSSNQGSGVALTDAPAITDEVELDRLTVQLYDRLDLDWKQKPTFDGELVYRVGVDRAGTIVGYKYANDAALTYLNETPLSGVQFASPAAELPAPATEPLAQFRVVFKSDGVLEVSPWDGQPDAAIEAPAAPSP